jgi:hypothetical protein
LDTVATVIKATSVGTIIIMVIAQAVAGRILKKMLVYFYIA